MRFSFRSVRTHVAVLAMGLSIVACAGNEKKESEPVAPAATEAPQAAPSPTPSPSPEAAAPASDAAAKKKKSDKKSKKGAKKAKAATTP